MSDQNIDVVNNNLLQRCKEGNDLAFDDLVENTKNEVYALAFRYTRDGELAYDISQEAYIRLYKYLPKWNFSCRVQTWLYRVVSNVCIDYHRKNKQQVLSLEVVGSQQRAEFECQRKSSNPRKFLQAKERRDQLERTISLLPKKMQEVFRLRYIGGLSLKEISEVQNCSIVPQGHDTPSVKETTFPSTKAGRIFTMKSRPKKNCEHKPDSTKEFDDEAACRRDDELLRDNLLIPHRQIPFPNTNKWKNLGRTVRESAAQGKSPSKRSYYPIFWAAA